MTCYHPIDAWMPHSGGPLIFSPNRQQTLLSKPIKIACGRCVGCRLDRSKQWAIRCMHEASLHDQNCFITLTYDNEHLPADLSLDYDHYQRFMKRLRRRFPDHNIRFYMAGEYGEKFGRPHYHACIFGFDFPDRELLKDGKYRLYRSAILESLWPYGHSSVGDVTFQSAGYVARYIMKKQLGKNSAEAYELTDLDTGEIFHRTPEFNRMSLKPGIGADWFDKYKDDVYPHDFVIVNGKKNKVPKYYDNRLKSIDVELLEEIKSNRVLRSQVMDSRGERRPERLLVKEKVQMARLTMLNRTLDKDLVK